MKIGLGMDTGGTYTDAVIMDLESGEILDKAKSMTTREDLCIGIRNAIGSLDPEYVRQVNIVTLSSTLATNSVVEGKGCRVGLICMGGDYNFDVPADYSIRVSGSHDFYGDEDEPLDEDAVRRFLESVKGKIDGLAISGFLSIRNPDHELRVKKMAREMLDVPVVCGHELSMSLGFSERATTCIMNSRLIPIIDELIVSMEKVLEEAEIHAPLMMFRGDGSMMSSQMARERPVETILSGPAASLMGAMHMTGLRDAVVVDMGGTTTDIGVLNDGRPFLEPEGAIIGGKRTRVMAAQVATSGIGGDSRIGINVGSVELTSLRVMPLCVAASRWPNVAEYLNMMREFPPGRTLRKFDVRRTVYRIEFLRTLKFPKDTDMVSEADRELLGLLAERPLTITAAAMKLNRREDDFDIPKLEEYGLLQRIGLTPTDILHADGTYTEFDTEASKAGVEHMAAMCDKSPEEFIEEARRKIREKIAEELMDVLLYEETGCVDLGKSGRDLVRKAITRTPGKNFECKARLNKPIIGIGAPSGVYVRWLKDIFDTDVIIDKDSDVGNAVGAVTASVSETVEVLIRPMLKIKGDSRIEAFSKMGRFWYGSIDEAVEAQKRMAEKFTTAEAEKSHAENVTVSVSIDRHKYMNIPRYVDLDEVVMKVTAAGKPKQF